MIDKIRGYIYGSAYGDALGAPIEFLSHEAIIHRYGPDGINEPIVRANWTDDTEIMMAVGKGIIAEKTDNFEIIMTNVAKQFIKWLGNTGLAPGMTCLTACQTLKRGKNWKESGIVDSKGCGSAMRSGILGFLFEDKEALKVVAHNVGIITHGHIDADVAAQAAALLVYYAKHEIAIQEYPRLLRNDIGGLSEKFDNLLNVVEKLIRDSDIDDVAALGIIGQGWVGDEAVLMALYCILKYPDDYPKVLRTAVNITGDSDSIGAIAEGIMGTKIGFEKLPKEWKDRLIEKERLEAFIKLLEDYLGYSGNS